MRGLAGKVGIIAGGARGIGAATARRLCEEGVKVVIGDILLDEAKKIAAEIEKAGGDIQAILLDGTNAESQEEIVAKTVEKYGRLDFYHSNLAGGTQGDTDAVSIEMDVLDKSFDINTKSHVLACKYAIPAMLKTGSGSIIITSSGAATGQETQRPAYAMTKNALHALSRHVARTWGSDGIRANVICPGLIMTEAVEMYMDEAQMTGILRRTPSHRLGRPADIAATVAFLASDDAEFVNGQVWHVNGGSQMPG